MMDRIYGKGDYHIGHIDSLKYNSIVNSSDDVKFQKRSTRLTNREFIGDVISASNVNSFGYSVFSLNPGIVTSFPWLSQIATSFESYRFHGLVFEYKTMSADALNSTNTALGQVIMSFQYDANNAPFQNKQVQENYENSISVKPSCSAVFGVECEPRANVLTEQYVRSAAVPSGTSVQLYDMGNFQISTNGFQAASVNIGELWVTYDVELFHPKLDPGAQIACYHARLNGVSSSDPLGTSSVAALGNTMQCLTTFTTVYFPSNVQSGNFIVQLGMTGTSTPSMTYPNLSFTNCQQL